MKKFIILLLVLTMLMLTAWDVERDEFNYIRHRTDLAQVGDIIQFGEYSWVVLDVDGDHALILSEHVHVMHYAYERLTYAHALRNPNEPLEYSYWAGVFHYRHEPTTWASSSLRRYLNNEFFSSFEVEDRVRIRETYVVTNNNPWYWDRSAGENFGYAGDNTYDRIFVLSIEEILKYFGDSGQFENPPGGGLRWISDKYDDGRIGRTVDGQPMWWWSRTPGRYRRHITGVDVAGVIYVGGMSASTSGGGIRPAMWISLVSPWDQENFTNIREPLHLDEDTSHGKLAMEHLLFMNDHLYSRLGFTDREEDVAVWIIEELLAMGHPWESIEVQVFPEKFYLWCRPPAGAEFLESAISSQNIVLTIPGQTEEKIVVAAHYDSWDTPGASDNASGTAVLLESAQRMLDVDNYYTIVYVFLGGHEVGAVPATFFINNLTYEEESNIVLMVNVDNLFDGPYMFYGAAYNDDWQPGANDLTLRIDAIAKDLDLGFIGHPPMVYVGSDHNSFLYRGHTVVFFMALSKGEIQGQVGFFEKDGYQFIRGWSHTSNDDAHIIEEKFPGLIQRNIHAYSVFLDEILNRFHMH